MTPKGLLSLGALMVSAATLCGWMWRHQGTAGPTCGMYFFPNGTRCCPNGKVASAGRCGPALVCPKPLVLNADGCDAPITRIFVPHTHLEVGPSDWEAEGRVAPRTLDASPFQIDAFEVTVGQAFCATCPLANPLMWHPGDAAQAAAGLSRDQAERVCSARKGRLPTEDEWIAAASGPKAQRYPWGNTGAVCRRAAWGLTRGPCIQGGAQLAGATEPDTVGSHPDGDTESGIHDLAGNVAEWVSTANSSEGVLRGGSFSSEFAAEIRTWSRLVIAPEAHDARAGVRCAYD